MRKVPLRKKRDPALLRKGLKECFKCSSVKTLEEFAPAERGVGRRAAYCRPCMSAYVLEQRAKDTGFKEKLAKYRQGEFWKTYHRGMERKRKARKKDADTGTVTSSFVEKLYAQEICFYCKRYTPFGHRTMDHVIALAVGGLHDANNLVMACGRCNSRKRITSADDFRRKLNGL